VLLALVLALFPKKLPRAAHRKMAEIGAGKSVNTTTEISFSGKQPYKITTGVHFFRHHFTLTLKAFSPISNSHNCNSNCVSDLKMVLLRLTKNKVLLYNSLSAVCFMFGYIGYWVFMPKYIETQFRQSASTSSMLTGKHTAYSMYTTTHSLQPVYYYTQPTAHRLQHIFRSLHDTAGSLQGVE
jgi:hypothetical protein